MTFERNTLLAILVMALVAPFATSNQYLLHLLIMVLFYAVLATSLNLVVGYVGEFSLGHTAFLGIGAYTAALLSARLGWPVWATIPAAGLVAASFGALIGAITLRLQGPYFVIVTLAFAEVLRLLANNWIGLTNGPMGIAGVGQPEVVAAASHLGAKRLYYLLALGIITGVLYTAYRFAWSNLGRAAVAIRENRYIAQSIGISPFATALLAFVISACFAGFGGGFYAHYISYVGPEVFSFSFTISMIIMVLMGGKGTLLGPLLGALLVTGLQEYLREAQELRLTLFGLVVIGVVLFLPQGLMGVFNRFRAAGRMSGRTSASVPGGAT